MPVIPLPVKNNPLPDLPRPVLDRERRPTVDNRAERSAIGELGSITRPLISGDAMAAPYEALGSVGRAVVQTGSLIAAAALKEEEGLTIKQVADAENAMLDEVLKHREFQQSSRDPQSWMPTREKDLSALKNRLLGNQNLTGAARERITLLVDKNQRQQMLQTQSDARVRINADAKSALGGRLALAKEMQDDTSHEATLKEMVTGGWATPEQAQIARIEFKREGERQAKQREADEERSKMEATQAEALATPKEFLASYEEWNAKNKGADPAERLRMERGRDVAAVAIRQKNAEDAQFLEESIYDETIKTPKDVDYVALQLGLDPAIAEHVKKTLLQKEDFEAALDRRENARENYGRAWRMVQEYDPSKEVGGIRQFDIRREIRRTIGDEDGGYLLQVLQAKATGRPPEIKPRDEMTHFADETVKGMFADYAKVDKLDASGNPVIDYETGRPKRIDDPKKLQEAREIQAQIMMDFRDWHNRNPSAPLPEVKKKLEELIPEGKRGAMFMNILQPTLEPQAAAPPRGALDEDLITAVKGFETFIPKAYGDYKQTSVGYGTRAKSADEELTEPQADARLREELSMHAGNIDKAAREVGLKLSKGQRNALISFDFNTGAGTYLIESSKGNLSEIKRRLQL